MLVLIDQRGRRAYAGEASRQSRIVAIWILTALGATWQPHMYSSGAPFRLRSLQDSRKTRPAFR